MYIGNALVYKLWHSLFLVTTFHTLGHTSILIQKLQVICGILRLIKTLNILQLKPFQIMCCSMNEQWQNVPVLAWLLLTNTDFSFKISLHQSMHQHSQNFFARWWTLSICEGTRFLFNNSSHQQLHWDLTARKIKVLPEKLTPSFLLLMSNN